VLSRVNVSNKITRSGSGVSGITLEGPSGLITYALQLRWTTPLRTVKSFTRVQ